MGPGDFFGEYGLLLNKKTRNTAVALSDVFILVVNKDSAVAFIKDEPEMTFELMKAICGRFDMVSHAYEKQTGRSWRQPHAQISAAEPKKEAKPETPSAQPAAAVQAPTEPFHFTLFPEGHGSYQLPVNTADHNYLMDKSYTCPICGKSFTSPKVKSSKLTLTKTDSDMRSHYEGVEPIYFDVVTCPNCLYSTSSDIFNSPEKPKDEIMRELSALKSESKIVYTGLKDVTSIFAGYYLALHCIPKCFVIHQLHTAKLLFKLYRIYQDCEDKHMEEVTAKRALDAYLYVYQNMEVAANQDQQICLIIGELYLKLSDNKNARDFFLKAKNNRNGAPLLKSQAENRIMDIRVMEGRS